MKTLHRTEGLSILEVLIAATLFGAVAAGLGVATIGSIKANGASKNIAAATTLIYDKFDQLRALNPATDPADLLAGSHYDQLNPLTPLAEADGQFWRTWTVSANTPRVGLSEVVVRVNWTDTSERSVQGVAYVCTSPTCS